MKTTRKRFKKIMGVVLTMVILLGFTIIPSAEAIPRIIIKGYSTDKTEIKSGDTFNLTIHMENVSPKTDLTNIKLTLSTPENEIVPTSGSNTVYVEKIPKGETYDLTVEMIAQNDLESKSYVLTVASDYEDRYSTPYQDSQNIIIPIIQNQRVMISDVSTSKDTITVGEKSSISFTINNQGKGSLYNVSVKLTGEGIEETTSYIGNILPGAMGYADITTYGAEANGTDGTVTATIYYEDNAGNLEEISQDIKLIILDVSEITPEDYPIPDEEVTPSVNLVNLLIPIVAVVLVIIIIIVPVITSKKRKKDEEKDEF